jgi:hypothetical protein
MRPADNPFVTIHHPHNSQFACPENSTATARASLNRIARERRRRFFTGNGDSTCHTAEETMKTTRSSGNVFADPDLE